MHQSIGKVLPADGYRTHRTFQLTHDQYQAIHQLYQPIIGMDAISLYQTLYHQISFHDIHSHHYLMQLLNRPLTAIYEARRSCEAIGFMDTYKQEKDEVTLYDFHLKEPFTPAQFMEDDVLSQLLYHQIGKQKFKSLKEKILENTSFDRTGTKLTASFSDVFLNQGDLKPTEMTSEKSATSEPTFIEGAYLDFEYISQNLNKRMLPANQILTLENQKLMNQMAALYQLSTTEVDKLLQWSIDSSHLLDREAFKEACLDAVDVQPSKKQIIIQRDRMKKSADAKAQNQKELSKKDRFIEQMETISPKELLEDLSGGNRASAQDLKMIASTMEQQGLTPGVMNVLIHYVMLKSDMKLQKGYLDKIASHWARKQIKTVKEAMALAKEEHQKYQTWQAEKKTPKKNTYNRFQGKKDIIPDWFNKQKSSADENETSQKQSTNSQQSTAELEALLEAYKQKKDS